MPPIIEVSDDLYERLGKLAKAFDQPADVIERLLAERATSTSSHAQYSPKSSNQDVVARPAAGGYYQNQLGMLGQAFKIVFDVNPRPFGQKSNPLSGFSDDAKGVQWNAALNTKDGSCFLGVNLEGIKYRNWPIARLLLQERDSPTLQSLTGIPGAEKIYVFLKRDAWQCAARPEILEDQLTGSGTLLSELTRESWLTLLHDALTCLDERQDYLGRKIQLVTLAKSGQKEEKEVSPHLNIRTPLWVTPPNSVDDMVTQIRNGRDQLLPIYQRIRELTFEGDSAIFNETVDPEGLKPDPWSPNYTEPPSYGVYKIGVTRYYKAISIRQSPHPLQRTLQ